jgi:hypothetical protein
MTEARINPLAPPLGATQFTGFLPFAAQFFF